MWVRFELDLDPLLRPDRIRGQSCCGTDGTEAIYILGSLRMKCNWYIWMSGMPYITGQLDGICGIARTAHRLARGLLVP